MKFNNNDLSSLVTVERVKRHLLPAVKNTLIGVPGSDGEKHIRTRLGARLIEVDIRIIADKDGNLQDDIRALAGKLYSVAPAKLELDEADKYEMAVLTNYTDVDKFLHTGKVTLEFICPEPASYSTTETTVTISAADITNAGTYPATGIITITNPGTVSSLQVSLSTTGEKIHIVHDFINTDTILIDLAAENVTKNGVSIMSDVTLDSDFFELPVGKFKITKTAGTAVLKYRARWL